MWAVVDSNHRSRRQRIYSPLHLATLVTAQDYKCTQSKTETKTLQYIPVSQWRDSNPRPADYKSAALAN